MINKKLLYVGGGLALMGLAGYLYWRHTKHAKEEMAPGTASPNTAPTTKLTVTTGDTPLSAGTVHNDNDVHVVSTKGNNQAAPKGKLTGPNTVLQAGLGAIANKMLVAKYNGSGIYDTNLAVVGKTKQGQNLGYAIAASPASNGTYTLKYRDAQNNLRVVNSVAVNVLI